MFHEAPDEQVQNKYFLVTDADVLCFVGISAAATCSLCQPGTYSTGSGRLLPGTWIKSSCQLETYCLLQTQAACTNSKADALISSWFCWGVVTVVLVCFASHSCTWLQLHSTLIYTLSFNLKTSIWNSGSDTATCIWMAPLLRSLPNVSWFDDH